MGSMSEQFQSFQREHKQMMGSMREDFRKMTGKMQGQVDKNTDELKRGLQSKDDIVRLDSKTGLVMNEVRTLERKLMDRGLLAPPKPVEPPPEDVVPVGTLELDEDVFTARLMLRLGFMRGEAEAAEARREQENSSDFDFSDEEELMELALFENVQ